MKNLVNIPLNLKKIIVFIDIL